LKNILTVLREHYLPKANSNLKQNKPQTTPDTELVQYNLEKLTVLLVTDKSAKYKKPPFYLKLPLRKSRFFGE